MVASYTQLLANRHGSRFDAEERDFMAYIVTGASRMKQLIDDLLALSRVGTRGVDLKPVDCRAALEAALRNLQLAIRQSRAVVTRDQLPVAPGDESQLIQLFHNLVGNAVKFRRQRPPRVHIGVEQRPHEWVFSARGQRHRDRPGALRARCFIEQTPLNAVAAVSVD